MPLESSPPSPAREPVAAPLPRRRRFARPPAVPGRGRRPLRRRGRRRSVRPEPDPATARRRRVLTVADARPPASARRATTRRYRLTRQPEPRRAHRSAAGDWRAPAGSFALHLLGALLLALGVPQPQTVIPAPPSPAVEVTLVPPETPLEVDPPAPAAVPTLDLALLTVAPPPTLAIPAPVVEVPADETLPATLDDDPLPPALLPVAALADWAPPTTVTEQPAAATPVASAVVPAPPTPLAGNRPPVYPEPARRARAEGVVTVILAVAADGTVSAVKSYLSSGEPLLDQEALRTVRTWRFTPARANGEAVACEVSCRVRFALTAAAGD